MRDREPKRRRPDVRRTAAITLLTAILTASSAGAEPAVRARAATSAEQKAQQKRKDQAVELHDEARVLYDRGEYRIAIKKLEAAVQLDPEAKELIYNLAVIHEKLGEIDAAERYYRGALAMETDPKVAERIRTVLKRIEGARKELADRSSPAGEDASTDDVNEGPSSPAGEKRKKVAPQVGPLVLVAGSVSAVAFAAGTVFALSAVGGEPDSDAKTGRGLSAADLRSDAETAHSHAVVADVAFIVAIVAGGTALYLHFSGRGHLRSPNPSATAPAPVIALPKRGFEVQF